MWESITREFERGHPDIHVALEHIPGPGEVCAKDGRVAGLRFSPRCCSALRPALSPLHRQARWRHPILLDLTALLKAEANDAQTDGGRTDGGKKYWPTAWQSFGQDEADGYHQYGLPVFGGNNLIFYNRECFRRAGVELPEVSHIDSNWTAADFLALCRRLTVRDGDGAAGRTVQWGFDLPAGWLYWLPFIYACDADILNADRTEFVFTGDKALAALKLWRQLIDERLVPRGGELGQMRQNVAFLTDRVAMVCDGPWQMPFLNEAGLDYGVMFPPRSASGRRARASPGTAWGYPRGCPKAQSAGKKPGRWPASSPHPRRPKSSPGAAELPCLHGGGK